MTPGKWIGLILIFIFATLFGYAVGGWPIAFVFFMFCCYHVGRQTEKQ